jgi:hypothetical protein
MATENKIIDDLIKEIEDLSMSENNQELIEKSFKKLNHQIEDLLDTNPDFYEYYKYQYHIKYSSFLHVIGNKDGANRHENFSKKYKDSYLNRACNKNTGSNSDESQINCKMINLDNTCDFLEDNSNYDNSIFSKIESFNLIDAKYLVLMVKSKRLNLYLEVFTLDQLMYKIFGF